MKNRVIYFFLSFCFLFNTFVYGEEAYQCSTTPIPTWVKPCEFSLPSNNNTPSQTNFQQLLLEVQRNWEEKAIYRHSIIKALNRAGVEKVSKYMIDFNPEYEKVVFHTLRVFRDGKWVDRLSSSRHHLLQRETALDRNLYRGHRTLVYFLEDIREGDIVEYACSIIGGNPFFDSHYSDFFAFQTDFPREKVFFRFLAHPRHFFSIRPFYTSIIPHTADLSPTLREWSWEITKAKPYTPEDGQPAWHTPHARIQISEYKNWQEVAQKIQTICSVPEDSIIPIEMKNLATKWMSSTPDKTKQATMALRFIQDEVRYLGLEDGIWSIKPADPCLVFQRRFGDCKDKTFLLQALLKLMNIHSTPHLVHSVLGRNLPQLLPVPQVFDHAVLKIEIGNDDYWVDPTIALQGGTLKDRFFPNYYWGLRLAKDTAGLTPLPKPIEKKLVEITTFITFETLDYAKIEISTTYHGFIADDIRRKLANIGLEKMAKECLKAAQGKYRGAIPLSQMSLEDQRENNTLIRKETYRVPVRERTDKKFIKICSRTIDDFLDTKINPERFSPYKLIYPLWVTEDIHVENRFKIWESKSDDSSLKNDFIHYAYSMEAKDHTVNFHFELKNLQDHIPISGIGSYWHAINEIEPNPALEIFLNE